MMLGNESHLELWNLTCLGEHFPSVWEGERCCVNKVFDFIFFN